MVFKDLRDFFDGTLRLPVDGKEYVIPPCSAKDGLWAQALMDTALKAAAGGEVDDADLSRIQLDDADERSLYERLLGPAFGEMQDDGLDWPSISRCGVTAFVFFTQGEEAAQKVWEQQPSGEAEAPNRETRRQGSKASAASTPRRGSMSGTSSRTTSKRALPEA